MRASEISSGAVAASADGRVAVVDGITVCFCAGFFLCVVDQGLALDTMTCGLSEAEKSSCLAGVSSVANSACGKEPSEFAARFTDALDATATVTMFWLPCDFSSWENAMARIAAEQVATEIHASRRRSGFFHQEKLKRFGAASALLLANG